MKREKNRRYGQTENKTKYKKTDKIRRENSRREKTRQKNKTKREKKNKPRQKKRTEKKQTQQNNIKKQKNKKIVTSINRQLHVSLEVFPVLPGIMSDGLQEGRGGRVVNVSRGDRTGTYEPSVSVLLSKGIFTPRPLFFLLFITLLDFFFIFYFFLLVCFLSLIFTVHFNPFVTLSSSSSFSFVRSPFLYSSIFITRFSSPSSPS